MWSCAINTVVHLRNRTYTRVVGPSGGVSLTRFTGTVLDAYAFQAFGCAIVAKVLDNLTRKLGMKAFRSVIVGYSQPSPGYRVYNPSPRRITTSFHVKIQEKLPCFGTSHTVDSSIDVFFDVDDSSDAPASHSATNLTP
jgi:hypothetical protein